VIGDALVIANEAKFDVLNALTLMDNVSVLQDLKVCSHRTTPLAAGCINDILAVWGWRWDPQLLSLQLADSAIGRSQPYRWC
jgi:Myristoyl-CoA:protein N-myristoyltransferase, C-terminal domain